VVQSVKWKIRRLASWLASGSKPSQKRLSSGGRGTANYTLINADSEWVPIAPGEARRFRGPKAHNREVVEVHVFARGINITSGFRIRVDSTACAVILTLQRALSGFSPGAMHNLCPSGIILKAKLQTSINRGVNERQHRRARTHPRPLINHVRKTVKE